MLVRIVVMMIVVQFVVLDFAVCCGRGRVRDMLQFLARLAQPRLTGYAGRGQDTLVTGHLNGIGICRQLTAHADCAAVANGQASAITALRENTFTAIVKHSWKYVQLAS